MVVKFTRQQIERFNDGIEYCLKDEDCASILQEFLLHTYKKDNLTRAFNLWTLANKNSMLTDEIQDLIDEVDDFQRGDMDKMNPHEQIEYVKRECNLIAAAGGGNVVIDVDRPRPRGINTAVLGWTSELRKHPYIEKEGNPETYIGVAPDEMSFSDCGSEIVVCG
ncbi:hypothetical protein GEV33_006518 [Tenebrio molitor]|uniref:Uncharacterized protein n=1 Tax=Tenebrio molitor TaxID=7067 RepID=A0A8J6HMH6_TENMO|nr:hypothetical protein GEV33_006518 [Tenebrio molitor]